MQAVDISVYGMWSIVQGYTVTVGPRLYWAANVPPWAAALLVHVYIIIYNRGADISSATGRYIDTGPSPTCANKGPLHLVCPESPCTPCPPRYETASGSGNL